MDKTKKSWRSRVGIVVIAAILVEVISVFQYQRARKMMDEELSARSHLVLNAISQQITSTLGQTESTMRENLWEVRRSMAHPDSTFNAIVYLIDDNPQVIGGCMAFVPDYYPKKGRLFEPYGWKVNGQIVLSQLGGPEHDYTQNPVFQKVLETQTPFWSDPYTFGPDSLSLATYSCPVKDASGRIAAVCGLDIDLSWLGDSLNARKSFPSSFRMLLTEDGTLVAGPSQDRVSPDMVKKAVAILNGALPASSEKDMGIRHTRLRRDPYWQVVQVYSKREVFAKMRRMRVQHVLMILLGLLILAFMIERYARNEKTLRLASEEQARIGGELEVARNIQREMLPKTSYSFAYGSLEPALEVGGDLFDYFTRDGKLFFCIGDVSGKGVPSAMLMSMIHSMFRLISAKQEKPSFILSALNEQLCRGNDSNMFVTFFVGCLDLYSGELRFGNAGHDKPFVVGGDISLLPTKSNLPLGVFPDTHFEEQVCNLAPGTTLLLYTDGLTEAKNTERKPFGRDGVTRVLEDCVSSGAMAPSQLASALSEAAHAFAGDAPQSDDLTLLVVRYILPENVLRQQITLRNNTEEVARLSDFVKDFCGKLEVDRKTAAGLRLALEETVVNVISYAFPADVEGEVTVLADSDRKEVRFTVVDAGIPFDPTAFLEADTTLDAQNRPIGGLGIHLTRKLMDSTTYVRREGKNVLTLTKSIS